MRKQAIKTKFPRAYAVVGLRSRRGVHYPITVDATLPIYWSRIVAEKEARNFGGQVVPVLIEGEK